MAKVEPTRSNTKGYVLVAVVYLLGLFIGALDTGIVTPARTVIQSGLGVDEQLGVWMITIYTLAYAAAIPVMGKLADRFGRKSIYLTSILLFGVGSLFCGLAQDFGSFELLIAARALQAIGGGGIMPVATAEFGTAFPEEKRGMALGLVGGVYGIANVFGASAGSLILDIFGQQNWQFIFYVNIPICLFILAVGFMVLPNTKEREVRPIDGLGIGVLVIMVLSLLYGLRNLDFFDFGNSIVTQEVYPFLIAFAVLIPFFILIEKRASDPVMNLAYFKDRSIVVTMLLSIITGVVMMGMIFIPQFSENALGMPSGSGGYFVIILAVFAGVGSPISGKLIDRFGVKIVLGFGLAASAVGSLFLALVATNNPSVVNVVVSLILIGIGMGFTMGTPLNYMMLAKTKESESNSALATLSLVRSIGTAVAPAIMIAFLAHAGATVQENLLDVMPEQANVSLLPHEQDVTDELATLKADPELKDKLSGMNLPDFSSMHTINVNMNSNGGTFEVPADLLESMKSADVTTIVATAKTFASTMFDEKMPTVTKDVNAGIDKGLDSINTALSQIDTSIATMQKTLDAMGPAAGQSPMQQGFQAMKNTRDEMSTLRENLQAMKDGVPAALESAKQDYLTQIDERATRIEGMFQKTLNEGFRGLFALVAACSIVGLVLLPFYRDDKRKVAA